MRRIIIRCFSNNKLILCYYKRNESHLNRANTNINFLLEQFGINWNNDCVARTSFYKYFHPKESLVHNGILNEEVSRVKFASQSLTANASGGCLPPGNDLMLRHQNSIYFILPTLPHFSAILFQWKSLGQAKAARVSYILLLFSSARFRSLTKFRLRMGSKSKPRNKWIHSCRTSSVKMMRKTSIFRNNREAVLISYTLSGQPWPL